MHWLAAPRERPYTHSLLCGIILASGGRITSGTQQIGIAGIAAGVMTHLLRDMATGGVLFYWPLVRRSIRIPYWSYAAILLCLALAQAVPWPQRGEAR